MTSQSRYSKYYQEHKEKCAAASRAWRLANLEKVRVSKRAWRENNPEKVKDAKRRHRDLKAEREGRAITPRRQRLPRPVSSHDGLTEEGAALIERVATRPPVFLREGFDPNVTLNGEQILDRDGVPIQFEGDEDLDLANEAVGAGRRGLKAQSAEDSRSYYQENREAEIERSKFYNRAHPEVRIKYRQSSVATLRYNIGTRRRTLRERRVRVITHYGNGKMICVLCGEKRGPELRIDYTDEGRDRSTRYSGEELYRRLEQRGYPKGYRTICRRCQLNIRTEALKKMKSDRLTVLEEGR